MGEDEPGTRKDLEKDKRRCEIQGILVKTRKKDDFKSNKIKEGKRKT